MAVTSTSAQASSLLEKYNKLLTDPAYQWVLRILATKRRPRRCGSVSVVDSPPPKAASFIDVPSTGMRLAYYDYVCGSLSTLSRPSPSAVAQKNVILLLHDAGSSAAVWHDVASALADTGAYRVISLDIRGHGRSTWGCSSSSYHVELLAKDVHGFIVEKALYGRPVCVFGIGMGGLVGMVLASMGGRKLVGAVGMLEGGVVIGKEVEGGEGQPWVCKSMAGGGGMVSAASIGEMAGWLANPLSGLGPRLVREAFGIVESRDGNDVEKVKQQDVRTLEREIEVLLEYGTGDEEQCLRLAQSLLREDGRGRAVLRSDPAFHLHFSEEQVRRTLESLDMHVLFMFGAYSLVSSRQDICALSSLCTSATSVTVEELPEQSSRFVRDDPEAATDALLEFVVYSATDCFEVGDEERTPESLGLRPLDVFESLEAAQKALGPRKVPTREAIENALRELRVQEGRDADDASSSDDGDGIDGSGSATGLCQDDKNYFGFIG